MRVLCVNPETGEERWFPFESLALHRKPTIGAASETRIVNLESVPYHDVEEARRAHCAIETYNERGWDIETVADLEEFVRLCEH